MASETVHNVVKFSLSFKTIRKMTGEGMPVFLKERLVPNELIWGYEKLWLNTNDSICLMSYIIGLYVFSLLHRPVSLPTGNREMDVLFS